jgi:hypothetical protein
LLKVAVLDQGGHLGGEDYQAGDAGDHRRRRRCGRGTSGRCSWSSWLTGSGCPVCWTAGRASPPARARHRTGPVGTDLAVMLADGGDCLSDLAALRDQPEWWAEQVVKLPR